MDKTVICRSTETKIKMNKKGTNWVKLKRSFFALPYYDTWHHCSLQEETGFHVPPIITFILLSDTGPPKTEISKVETDLNEESDTTVSHSNQADDSEDNSLLPASRSLQKANELDELGLVDEVQILGTNDRKGQTKYKEETSSTTSTATNSDIYIEACPNAHHHSNVPSNQIEGNHYQTPANHTSYNVRAATAIEIMGNNCCCCPPVSQNHCSKAGSFGTNQTSNTHCCPSPNHAAGNPAYPEPGAVNQMTGSPCPTPGRQYPSMVSAYITDESLNKSATNATN